jgi:predicted hotdog family 3-hydroxylacyl-ACP dehydratase
MGVWKCEVNKPSFNEEICCCDFQPSADAQKRSFKLNRAAAHQACLCWKSQQHSTKDRLCWKSEQHSTNTPYLYYLYPMSFPIQPAAEFIPQKPPFVLVDKLIFVDESVSRCSFRIPEDHIFVSDGSYSTPGLVESMAQTAAAGTGYLSKKKNKEVPVGYIGAVQKLEVYGWPPVNGEIVMEIGLITNILQVSLVAGTVKYQGKIIAKCEMKIFINSQS